MSIGRTLSAVLAELKACSSLQMLKRNHQAVIQAGYDSDVYVGTTLISMYGSLGSLVDAQAVFDGMPTRTVVSWNALILGYADNGEGGKALWFFSKMFYGNCPANARTFVTALKACTILAGTEDRFSRGKALHLHSAQNGSDTDIYVTSSLVGMYAKCNKMNYARKSFENLENPDVVSWNALILGYADNGESLVALELFCRVRAPDSRTFVASLKSCTDLAQEEWDETHNSLTSTGRAHSLHILAIRCGCSSDMHVTSALVDLYSKCMSMQGASRVFYALKQPNAVCWNAFILGYVDSGDVDAALAFFSSMVYAGHVPDARTLVTLLRACIFFASNEEGINIQLNRGMAIHLLSSRQGLDSDMYMQSTLVDMYAKCGAMEEAKTVFDGIEEPDLVSVTSLILGYSDTGNAALCLDLFSRIRVEITPDGRAFVAALKACSELAVDETSSERVNALILLASLYGYDSELHFRNTLISMYAKLKSMENALQVFQSLDHLHVVCWNALILGYAENGDGDTALKVFSSMRDEGFVADRRTYVAAIKACTEISMKDEDVNDDALQRGKALSIAASVSGCDSCTRVKNTLIDMYANCGSMKNARHVFDMMQRPGVVSWTALMLGYADAGEHETVLVLFSRMQRAGCIPDARTYVGVVRSCSMLGALEFGKVVHAEISSLELHDEILHTCLVEFYARCGSLAEAQRMFDEHPTRELIAWNALLTGYRCHGDTGALFYLFQRMRDLCVQPDSVTFLCVLTACSHGGLVEKGRDVFDSMSKEYGLFPGHGHYTCMIDLLGRANKLDDAMVLLRTMPFTGNEIVWMTVLGACQLWKNANLGRLAFEALTCLDGANAAAYVLMANIYTSSSKKRDYTPSLISLRSSYFQG